MVTGGSHPENGESVSNKWTDGSPSSRNEVAIATPSSENTFLSLNRLDIHGDDAASPGAASLSVYLLVIAAHPSEANQFALGLTDGGVYILEPLESEGKWGTSPPTENGAGPSTTSGATNTDQSQR